MVEERDGHEGRSAALAGDALRSGVHAEPCSLCTSGLRSRRRESRACALRSRPVGPARRAPFFTAPRTRPSPVAEGVSRHRRDRAPRCTGARSPQERASRSLAAKRGTGQRGRRDGRPQGAARTRCDPRPHRGAGCEHGFEVVPREEATRQKTPTRCDLRRSREAATASHPTVVTGRTAPRPASRLAPAPSPPGGSETEPGAVIERSNRGTDVS